MIGDVKYLYIIQSLSDNEVQSGYDLYNDVIVRNVERLGEYSHIIRHQYFNVNSRDGLFEILKYINSNSKFMRDGLAIHFETHGSDKKDGLILSNQSLVEWRELVDLFREINIGTGNNLYVTMATCFGRFLFEGVDPNLKSPYSGYISASKEVLVDDIIENFSDIYSNVISEGNLISSYLKSNAEKGCFYYKDSETTFEQLMAEMRHRLYNDPTYRKEVLEGPIITWARENAMVDKNYLDKMVEEVFWGIYERQKKAFEFSEEES